MSAEIEKDEGLEVEDDAPHGAAETGVETASGSDDGSGEGAEEGAEEGSEEGSEEAVDGDAPALEAVLEALLLAAAEPIALSRLSRSLSQWTRSEIAAGLEALGAAYEEGRRGIRLIEAGGGFQLRSAPDCAPWVRRLLAEKPPRLSRPLLETVAIVAYRQPVTRGEVEAIRGVNCDAVLGALVARDLIRVEGRRQTPGRPVEYGTTAAFLELFSLRDLGELPPLPDPEALARLVDAAEEAMANEDGETVDADGEIAEDTEPGGPGVAPGGGGSDPGGPGEGERGSGEAAGDEGGPEPGPDHR